MQRRLALVFPFLAMLATLPSLSCDSDGDPNASGGGQGGQGGKACSSNRGTLTGSIYYDSPPDDPYAEPAPGALVGLLRSAGDDPLYGMANALGHFSIDLPLGNWLVYGESDSECFSELQSISLDACEVVELELILDLCG